jgi:hypothetical protein
MFRYRTTPSVTAIGAMPTRPGTVYYSDSGFGYVNEASCYFHGLLVEITGNCEAQGNLE